MKNFTFLVNHILSSHLFVGELWKLLKVKNDLKKLNCKTKITSKSGAYISSIFDAIHRQVIAIFYTWDLVKFIYLSPKILSSNSMPRNKVALRSPILWLKPMSQLTKIDLTKSEISEDSKYFTLWSIERV